MIFGSLWYRTCHFTGPLLPANQNSRILKDSAYKIHRFTHLSVYNDRYIFFDKVYRQTSHYQQHSQNYKQFRRYLGNYERQQGHHKPKDIYTKRATESSMYALTKIWLASSWDSTLRNVGEARWPKARSPFSLTHHFSMLVTYLFKQDSPPLIDTWISTSKNNPKVLSIAGSLLTAGAHLSIWVLRWRFRSGVAADGERVAVARVASSVTVWPSSTCGRMRDALGIPKASRLWTNGVVTGRREPPEAMGDWRRVGDDGSAVPPISGGGGRGRGLPCRPSKMSGGRVLWSIKAHQTWWASA